MANTKTIGVRVPEQDKVKLEHIAWVKKTTPSDIIRTLVHDYLQENQQVNQEIGSAP